jgi:hypothetical protein
LEALEYENMVDEMAQELVKKEEEYEELEKKHLELEEVNAIAD